MNAIDLTIEQAARLIHLGEVGAKQISDLCYQRITDLNDEFNAYITVIRNADELNDREGLLQGVPIAVKDLFQTKGVATTAGTTFFREFVPDQNALVVQKLINAGAIINGKTNTHEIALGVTGINPHYGTVMNPWDKKRISGGSSSGSAVAVATGMALGALGTDTGGSIRIPASLCGVVGLKPTYGRVSTRGVVPLSWNLDAPGPLTKTVRDAAILLQVIAGYDELDPNSTQHPVDDYLSEIGQGIADLKIGILDGDYSWDAEPDVLEIIREAGNCFISLGATVTPVELNFLREAAFSNTNMLLTDAAAFHKTRLAENPGGFGDDTRTRLEMGRDQSAIDYALARKTQLDSKRQMERFFHHYDVLILPSTPVPAPFLDGTDAIKQSRSLTRFTAPFNLTGLPAISIPAGFNSEGLPVGLQIVTQAWAEKKLLRVAHAFEQATEWHKSKPTC